MVNGKFIAFCNYPRFKKYSYNVPFNKIIHIMIINQYFSRLSKIFKNLSNKKKYYLKNYFIDIYNLTKFCLHEL